MTFPRALTPLRHDEVAGLAGTRIAGDGGTGALVSAMVRELPRHLDDDDGTSAAQLGTAVLDLVTVLLAARLRQGSAVPPPTRQQALLTSIHAHIEAELGDPGQYRCGRGRTR